MGGTPRRGSGRHKESPKQEPGRGTSSPEGEPREETDKQTAIMSIERCSVGVGLGTAFCIILEFKYLKPWQGFEEAWRGPHPSLVYVWRGSLSKVFFGDLSCFKKASSQSVSC